jgi:hypothetical protein
MKNSIYLIVLIVFSIPKELSGQTIQDFGKKSFNEVQSMNNYKPCDIVYNKLLMYCVQDESKIVYLFKAGVLNAIQMHTIYSSEYEAKLALENEIKRFANKNNSTPIDMEGGGAMFYQESAPIAVSFKILNYDGNYYVATHIESTK